MPSFPRLSRRRVLTALSALGFGSAAFAKHLSAAIAEADLITPEMVKQAEWLAGIELDDDDRESLAKGLIEQLAGVARIRAIPVDADVSPALVFQPHFFAEPDPQKRLEAAASATEPPARRAIPLSADPNPVPTPSQDDLAWLSLADVAVLLAQKKLSSVELTKSYLGRLEKYDPHLKCVVVLLSESALKQAEESDNRRGRNESFGPLDGVPWVAKDLMAVPPWKTTWGAEPFRDQVRPNEATVAARLREAGGVLLAKVSLGALAWGDKWFGGITRNPWNLKQGSSGSSAGTASSVAAGLTTFGIGSETLGSIVSPCLRCRTCGLRPTFGRVSRYGCMPLAWSMDKLGPIARRVDDLAIIFAHMLGADGRDPSVVNRPFLYPLKRSIKDYTIGYVEGSLKPAESAALEWLKQEGAAVKAVIPPSRFPLSAMTAILTAEATTMFDEILRSDPKADLGLWPESFRRGQFISAVHYLQANRLRSELIAETEACYREVDVILGGDDLTLTNLSGHPSLVLTSGTEESRDGAARPAMVKLTAAMFRESELLAIGSMIQKEIPPLPARPPLDELVAAAIEADKAAIEKSKAEKADAEKSKAEGDN